MGPTDRVSFPGKPVLPLGKRRESADGCRASSGQCPESLEIGSDSPWTVTVPRDSASERLGEPPEPSVDARTRTADRPGSPGNASDSFDRPSPSVIVRLPPLCVTGRLNWTGVYLVCAEP